MLSWIAWKMHGLLCAARPKRRSLFFQTDPFFTCATGRLKLSEFGAGCGKLIFCRRADTAGPKESFYIHTSSSDPASLRQALSLAHGPVGTVRKLRTLYFVGRTRVRIDSADGPGNFLELEVILTGGVTCSAGKALAKDELEITERR